MEPILTMEFSARAGGCEYNEESLPIHNPEELSDLIYYLSDFKIIIFG